MTVEELREKVLADVKSNWYEMTSLESAVIEEETAKEVDSLIAAARQEGAEGERERIREAGVETDMYTDFHRVCLSNVHEKGTVFVVPASALSPAPKEPEAKP